MVGGFSQGLVAVHRLKTRPQFQATLAGGTVSRTTHFALHRLPLMACADIAKAEMAGPAPEKAQALFALDGVWMGAMVPKRWARRAVTRNTIKRQIYAVSAQFRNTLLPSDYVVRLRSAFDAQRFTSATSPQLRAAVRAELTQLFARATQGSAA